MGNCTETCSCSKNKPSDFVDSEEESIIKIKEKSLPLSKIKIEEISTIINNHQYDGILSISQLRSAFTEMQFNIDFFSDPDHQFSKLLIILQNTNKLYEVRTVMVCGILLGLGDIKAKFNAFFKIYENSIDNCLYKAKCREMIEDIIMMAAKKIPFIAVDDSEDPAIFTIPSNKIERYTDLLIKSKDNYIKKLLDILFIG